MAYMKDTEGDEIPRDDEHSGPLFDATLCDWGQAGPELAINVPMFFETELGVYNSGGVVTVPLKDILEEYLKDFKNIDGGEHINAFSEWLHDYADRLKT